MNKHIAVVIAAAVAVALSSYATPGYGVGEPELIVAAPNSLTVSAEVTDFGDSPRPATLTFVYGISSDTLLSGLVASTNVTAVGGVQATITRLSPSTFYFVKAVVTATDGSGDTAESEVVRLATPHSLDFRPPNGYTELEYVRATGAQYIDTGLYPDRTLRVTETLSTTDTGTDKMTFGVRKKNYAFLCWLGKNAGTKVYPAIGTSGNIANRNSGKTSGQKWTLDMGTDGLYVDGTAIFTAAEFAQYCNTTAVSTKPLLLFGLYDGNTVDNRKYVGNCYDFKAFQNNVLVRDYVPARRDVDGAVGFYDVAQDAFKTSASATALIAGPDVTFPIEATEVVENGALASISLAFAADGSSTRTLLAACGPAHGGNNPVDWYATNVVATIAADATSYIWPAPADWGSDTNLVVRFYFVDDPVKWSNTTFWHPYAVPSVTDVTLEGTGGDTIVVSGRLDSFPGENCTLSVYTGDNAENLPNAWTGLAGATLSETGDFTFTLFESDTSAARYITPGSTVYATVQAVSDGQVTRTTPVFVTMSALPVFAAAPSASVSRHDITLTGRLTNLGMNGASNVRLYVGPSTAAEEELVAVESPVVVTNTVDSFSITHAFADLETNYKLQFRATTTSAGGTATRETRSSVVTAKTLDTTTYTWKTPVTSGNWSDPANWTDNRDGDCCGYPRSSAATAIFTAGTDANVVFTEALTIGSLNLATGPVVTFSQGGASTNATKLTTGTLTMHNNSSQGGSITLDGVAIASTSGDTYIDLYRALRLVNGANLHVAGLFGHQASNEVVVADGSYLSCNGTYFGGGTLTISNGTFWTRGGHDIIGRNRAGGHIVFQGDHPLFYHANKDSYFYSSIASANVQLDFLVPAGGYAAAPIRAISTQVYYMGNNKSSNGSCALTVNVLEESPANFTDATITTPLISWPKGINKNMVHEGHLPAYGEATDDAFVWGDATSYPKTLDVTINGSSHSSQIQVTCDPAFVVSDTFSPALGYSPIAPGTTAVCSVPTNYVYVTEDTRALCTGWKLYDVDPDTRERTLANSGGGNTCNVADTGGWRNLEWQWRIEYRVTVSGEGGTYNPASQWVVAGESATVVTTPDDGRYLYAFSNSGPDAVPVSTNATFTVTAPVDITATYRGCFWVAPDGDNENDGLTRATAKATLQAALALTSSTIGDKVIIADGDYTLAAAVTISTPCIVESENGRERTRFFSNGAFRPFYVNNANAVLQGVTIHSDRTSIGSNALYVNVGTARDCVVSNFLCGTHPVYVASGTLENSTIVRNQSATSSTRVAGCIWMNTANAVVRNCLVTGNVGYNDTYGAAIHVVGGNVYGCLVTCNTNKSSGVSGIKNAGGTIDSCTVADNYSSSRLSPGLWNHSGRTIRNCLAYGNRNAAGTLDTEGTGTFSHCATGTTAPSGTGNIQLGASPFADRAAGDYRVFAGPTIDAGSSQSWMKTQTDLYGNPRISGASSDIGCHEAVLGALAVAVSPSDPFVVGDGEITFTATPAGTNLTGLVYTWLVTDQTGATVVQVADDATGALTLPAGYGAFTVALTAVNEAGETATWTGEAAATRVPATLYVAKDSTPAFPYDTWETAAPNLKTALAWCDDGSTVIMGDGVWTNTSPDTLQRAITVKSLNGPDATKIFCATATTPLILNHALARFEGITVFSDHVSRGMAAVRIYTGTFADGVVSNFFSNGSQAVCLSSQSAILTNSVVIRNETSGRVNLVHLTADDYDRSGGKVINCRIIGNVGNNNDYGTAVFDYSGTVTIRNCLIACNTNKNSCTSAVWLKTGTMENCTIVGNYVAGSSTRAAVVLDGSPTVRNCIIHDNHNTGGVGNWSGTSTYFTYNCTTPLPSSNTGNVLPVEPMFADDAWHIGPGLCKDAGLNQSWMTSAIDLDGGDRIVDDIVDLGCYEYVAGALECTVVPSSAFIIGEGEVTLAATVVGPDTTGLTFTWLVTDQTGATAASVADSATATNLVLTLGYGAYDVSLTVRNAKGTEASFFAPALFSVKPQTVYVATDGAPEYPYDTHEKAFTNVIDAIDFAESGMRVVVADGTYTNATNPTLAKNIVLESENGPGATTIFAVNGTTVGWTLNSSGAVLRGFTLLSDNANGANPSSGRPAAVRVAAGTLDGCIVTNWYTYYTSLFSVGGSRAVVTNCLVTGCRTRYRCYFATFSSGLIANTRFIRNGSNTRASDYGSLLHMTGDTGNVRNCLFADNTIESSPPDASVIFQEKGTVENCTIVDNAATDSSTVPTVRVVSGAFRNNIVWGNTNKSGASGCSAASASLITYSCAPGLTGTGCTEGDPCFHNAARGDYTLRGLSPCIDTGLNRPWMEGAADLGGNPRVRRGVARGTVDMGCFENFTIPTMLFLR